MEKPGFMGQNPRCCTQLYAELIWNTTVGPSQPTTNCGPSCETCGVQSRPILVGQVDDGMTTHWFDRSCLACSEKEGVTSCSYLFSRIQLVVDTTVHLISDLSTRGTITASYQDLPPESHAQASSLCRMMLHRSNQVRH